MPPCVAALIQSRRTSIEDVAYSAGSRVAEGACRVGLDFPPLQIGQGWKDINAYSG